MCDATSVLDIDTGTLTARRLEWIRALESGAYAQCTGGLFRYPLVRDGDEVSPASYCCIGVGRDVIEPGHFPISEGNYRSVRRHYDTSEREVQRLVAMNDIRHRNFPFIARFLRKVWGLTGA